MECAAQRRAISYPMTEVIGMVDGFDLTLTRCPAVASIRRIEKDLIGMSQLEIPVCSVLAGASGQWLWFDGGLCSIRAVGNETSRPGR